MTKRDRTTSPPPAPRRDSGLRHRAETQLVKSGTRATAGVADDAAALVHELRVHQIELEMQAEELERSRWALEVSRDEYRDLYDHAPVGYVTLDAAGGIVEANLTAAAILGEERERLPGRLLSRYVSSLDAPTLHRHQQLAMRQAGKHTCEVQVNGPLGAPMQLQLETIGTGQIMRMVLVDVTARKSVERALAERTQNLAQQARELSQEMVERSRAEDELKQREVTLKDAVLALERERDFAHRLIETAPAIVLVLDSAGGIVRANSQLQEITGFSPEELKARDVLSLLFEGRPFEMAEDGAEGDAPQRRFSGRGRETAIFTKGGAVRYIEWYQTPFRYDSGAVKGILAVGQDVTERRQVEEALRQAQKMEAIGTLASGVAHDFNNVLMGIIGCANLALLRMGPDHAARVAVEHLKTAALGGSSVVERLMAFARDEHVERVVVDLNSLIARMDTMLRRLLGEDVELEVTLEAENAAVSCQPSDVEQMLLNLCVNARHAMPQGGRLSLRTSEERVDEQAEGNEAKAYVLVEIADTGCGMDETTRQRIFEPFFTTKSGGKGTGLGLATVYAAIVNHGGRIDVESEVGRGTRFLIRLRQSSEEVPLAPPTEPAITTTLSRETVLLVEDEPLVRMSLRYCLERQGCTVLAAPSWPEVARLVSDHRGPIDVLVADMVLPGQSGPEIAEAVRAVHPNMAVVYMSAHSNATLIREGRIPAGTPTLQKPFTEEALLARIREVRGEMTRSRTP